MFREWIVSKWNGHNYKVHVRGNPFHVLGYFSSLEDAERVKDKMNEADRERAKDKPHLIQSK